jgi:predicted dinucleotide-binding enzyme
MHIGILGSGLMGGKLGTIFARAGTPAEAVQDADAVLLAAHWSRGDDDGAKRVAATLIRDAGFEPLDAGPLRIARYLEPFTLLVGQLAYRFLRFR